MNKYITIKNATLDDVDTLFRWGNTHWELWGTERGKWYSKENLRRMIKEPRQDLFLVSWKGRKRIAMCQAYHLRDWAFLSGLFVEEAYRGSGIGKMLLNKAVEILCKQGIEDVVLIVDTNNPRALKFYLDNGFDKGYTFHFMAKSLKKENGEKKKKLYNQ